MPVQEAHTECNENRFSKTGRDCQENTEQFSTERDFYGKNIKYVYFHFRGSDSLVNSQSTQNDIQWEKKAYKQWQRQGCPLAVMAHFPEQDYSFHRGVLESCWTVIWDMPQWQLWMDPHWWVHVVQSDLLWRILQSNVRKLFLSKKPKCCKGFRLFSDWTC